MIFKNHGNINIEKKIKEIKNMATRFEVIKVEEFNKKFAVFFYRGYKDDYGPDGMANYPTKEPTDTFKVVVVPYIRKHADAFNGGYIKNSFVTSIIDKEIANRIWWNIKNGISYEELKRGLDNLHLLARVS